MTRRPADTVGDQVEELFGGYGFIMVPYGGGKYFAFPILVYPNTSLRFFRLMLGSIVSVSQDFGAIQNFVDEIKLSLGGSPFIRHILDRRMIRMLGHLGYIEGNMGAMTMGMNPH